MQVDPHVPAVHVGRPCVGIGQALVQLPQWAVSVIRSAHVPEHSTSVIVGQPLVHW